jgi:hypothetical protein
VSAWVKEKEAERDDFSSLLLTGDLAGDLPFMGWMPA